jgi:TATA-binding protein-associated factor Taf7
MGENIEKEINKEFVKAHTDYIERLEKRLEELEIEMNSETDPVKYRQITDEYNAVTIELEAAKRPIKEEE